MGILLGNLENFQSGHFLELFSSGVTLERVSRAPLLSVVTFTRACLCAHDVIHLIIINLGSFTLGQFHQCMF